MDTIQIGDIITRSDGQKYAIIDDDFPMANIPPDILQLPASSILARNLLGGRVGSNFNFNNQLTVVGVDHTNYLEEINAKKSAIVKENQLRREIVDIQSAFDKFDFQLAEELNWESNISDFNKRKKKAIQNLKKAIYDSTYNKNNSLSIKNIITKSISSGVISHNEVAEITRLATFNRNKYDKQQAAIYARRREQELLAWRNAQEEEEARIRREAEERNSRERRKRDSYKKVIAARSVKELIHFTNILNVETITKYGILPRNMVEKKVPQAVVNDINRFDDYRNATCLSVSFPNYKMFYRYQNESKNANWAVISLKPELLMDFDIKYFFFFKENAAKSDSSRCSFEEMFGNSEGCDPENPQAEILVFGIIPPKYIQRIYVNTLDNKNFLERKIGGNIEIVLNTKYFKYRMEDYL